MRLIKIGLANINTTVGSKGNLDKIVEAARRMAAERCAIGCFQEQTLFGYPAEDLVQWEGFVQLQWKQLKRFVEATARFGFPTLFAVGLTVTESGEDYNAAALIGSGRIWGVVPKEKLPTYGVFYDNRTFSRGIPGRVSSIEDVPFGDLIFRTEFGTVALEVCEDLWSPDGPMRRRCFSGAELVVNLSASPWRGGVVESRKEIISTRASDNLATVVYVNQVGGNDALVFDGGGWVNQCGRTVAEAPRWREGESYATVDLGRGARMRRENTTWRTDAEEFRRRQAPVKTIEVKWAPAPNLRGLTPPFPAHKDWFLPPASRPQSPREAYFEDLEQALVMGLDYFTKTGAFECLGIALSGGKDSVLSALIAWRFALKRYAAETPEARAAKVKAFVNCFSMPSRFNGETTRGISRRLCDEIGASFMEEGLEIEEAVGRENAVTQVMAGAELTKNTQENSQARLRGMRMWNWSNTAKGFWIQTSNMSEKAVGYTTIGGDMMGAYSLIANLPKTVIIAFLAHLAGKYDLQAVRDVLATKASAELAADQTDEADLMPFPVLDACFALFVGEKYMPVDVYRTLRAAWSDEELTAMEPRYAPGMLKAWVAKFAKLFLGSIYKWVQTPESVHVGAIDLDRERALQLPVVQSRDWLELEALDDLTDL